MKIKKGDIVLVIQGKDRGKSGKVLRANPTAGKILVDGLNIVIKHAKPKQQGKKGEKIQKPAAIDVSNVKLMCGQCKKPTRVGYTMNADVKVRVCKQCGATL